MENKLAKSPENTYWRTRVSWQRQAKWPNLTSLSVPLPFELFSWQFEFLFKDLKDNRKPDSLMKKGLGQWPAPLWLSLGAPRLGPSPPVLQQQQWGQRQPALGFWEHRTRKCTPQMGWLCPILLPNPFAERDLLKDHFPEGCTIPPFITSAPHIVTWLISISQCALDSSYSTRKTWIRSLPLQNFP